MSHNDIHIRVAGFGGQGVMMFGQVLAYAATIKSLNALWFPSYGPETRGGTANCQVIVSKDQINSPVFNKANHLIVFNHPSLTKFEDKIEDNGIILYNASLINDVKKHENAQSIGIPVNDIAIELGQAQVANMVMLGAYLELTNLFDDETIKEALVKFLGQRKAHMVDINLDAIKAGHQFIINHIK